MITSPVPVRRWWWPAATALAVTVVNAILVTLEMLLLHGKVGSETDLPRVVLVAHPIGGAASALLFSIFALARGGGSGGFVGYSERYLRGLVYGILTSIAISITAAIVGSGWQVNTIAQAGALLSLSVVTLQLPIACVTGGLTWHLISKRRGVPAGSGRPRRPIEDPE